MPSSKFEDLWTVVQHSAFGYAHRREFNQGLETRQITTIRDKRLVENSGGRLFNRYGEAEDFCMAEMYPDEFESLKLSTFAGIYPKAQGQFSLNEIDGLAIYIPRTNRSRNAHAEEVAAEEAEEGIIVGDSSSPSGD